MSKRLFLILTLLATVAFLTACGGGETSAPPPAEEEAAPTEEAMEATEEVAPTEEAMEATEEVMEEEATEEAMEEEMMEADPLGDIVIAPGDPIRIASALATLSRSFRVGTSRLNAGGVAGGVWCMAAAL
jgi:predicted small lipoprotein YifL